MPNKSEIDSAMGDSIATTVHPESSVSQSGAGSKNKPGKKRGKGGKNSGSGQNPSPAVPSSGSTIPPGAVSVPPAGSRSGGKPTQPSSGAIPVSGWGDIDLTSIRSEMRPNFTADAAGYLDLVHTSYVEMFARFSNMKHIPFSLFQYYCVMAWWGRVLFLKKSNNRVLTTDEKNFLNVVSVSSGLEFALPSPIAQYLANLGNFVAGTEEFLFDMESMDFSACLTLDDEVIAGGFLKTKAPNGHTPSNSAEFWAYAQYPVPGVASLFVRKEASAFSHAQNMSNIDAVFSELLPDIVGVQGTFVPTNNINCWDVKTDLEPTHSSVRSTFTTLGWGETTVPADTQTNFGISLSTMDFVSVRLSALVGLKTHSSSQIFLSSQGNPLLASFLCNSPYEKLPDLYTPTGAGASKRGTLHTNLMLASRFSIPAVNMSPTMSFCYRIRREVVRDSYGDKERSFFQPWTLVNPDGHPADVGAVVLAEMNRTFDLGSVAVLNIARFVTNGLPRAEGLIVSLKPTFN